MTFHFWGDEFDYFDNPSATFRSFPGPPSVALPTPPPTTPTVEPVGSTIRQVMPGCTHTLPGPSSILPSGDLLQMSGVDAGRPQAEMVDLEASRYRSNEVLVGPAISQDDLAIAEVWTGRPALPSSEATSPNPASAGIIHVDLLHEAIQG